MRESAIRTVASSLRGNPVVTEVTEAITFWPAENYHQEYFANHPYHPYCMMGVEPKVLKFHKQSPLAPASTTPIVPEPAPGCEQLPGE